MSSDIHEQQLRLRRHLEQEGIRDRRVLDALEATPRELFVPEAYRDRAYDDTALPIGSEQTISQPYIVALMTQALQLSGNEHVLEIGTGSGYQTAILSRLCRDIVTLERLPELLYPAQEILRALGVRNVEYRVGDGTLGWRESAPYDGILVAASAPDIPSPLYRQLAPRGRLVIPIGNTVQQELMLIMKREDGQPEERRLCGCRFVKLIGEAGWPDDFDVMDE